eukprot:2996141-Prymnesium_polylepis.1
MSEATRGTHSRHVQYCTCLPPTMPCPAGRSLRTWRLATRPSRSGVRDARSFRLFSSRQAGNNRSLVRIVTRSSQCLGRTPSHTGTS